MKKYLFLVFFLLVAAVYLQADDNAQNPLLPPKEEPQAIDRGQIPKYDPQYPLFPLDEHTGNQDGSADYFFTTFVNMLATLGIIIALILIVAWFLKKMLNTRIQQINTSSLIKIIERRTLTPKTSIYLLEFNGQDILIAESQNGVTQLAVGTENKSISDSSTESQAPSFEKILDDKSKKDKTY